MDAAIFGFSGFVGVIVLFLAVGVPLWAVVDALSRPTVAFDQSGTSRTAWVTVLTVSTAVGVGFFLGAFYLMNVRHKVRLHMARVTDR